MNILTQLRERFRDALSQFDTDVESLLDMIRPSQDPKFGDYQANMAMSLGKQLGRQPREVASEIVAQIKLDDLCSNVEVAGPGFVNLTIDDRWLTDQVNELSNSSQIDIEQAPKPRTFVIYYSSPNVAKPMHVGHLRSSVRGDSLQRLFRFRGDTVVSDIHLGDWGLQMGHLITGEPLIPEAIDAIFAGVCLHGILAAPLELRPVT